MIDRTKKAFYAAVGAPVVAAKRAGETLDELSKKVKELRGSMSDDLRNEVEAWAAEGEKLISRVSEQPVVEDLTSRIDLDAQVGKLREQLDEILESWRKNFRPESAKVEKVAVTTETKPAPAKKPAAKKPAAKKPAAGKPAAAKTASSKTTSTKAATARKQPAKASA